MNEMERFDALVFGSGTGGKLTAWTSASEGLRTAVVERRLIGGSCPNIACLPTKNVIHSAKVADFVRHDRDFGSGTVPASIAMAEVRARKRRMVDGLVSMHMDKYKESGAELVFGEGGDIVAHAGYTRPTMFDDMPTNRPHFFFLIAGRRYSRSETVHLNSYPSSFATSADPARR
jgi:hypothetical protein